MNRKTVSVFGLAAIMASLAGATLAAQGGPYERQKIDEAAATRGRAVYAQHCINCHGSTAKGTERGPDLIRSVVVLRDRLGNGIGPALRPSASHQAALSQRSRSWTSRTSCTSASKRSRPTATHACRSTSSPATPRPGARTSTAPGRAAPATPPTGDLAGLATRIADPVNLQQRFLFPTLRRDGAKQVEVT